MLQKPGHNRDIGPKKGHLATMLIREAHNFSNGIHTLRQGEALHGFVNLVAG